MPTSAGALLRRFERILGKASKLPYPTQKRFTGVPSPVTDDIQRLTAQASAVQHSRRQGIRAPQARPRCRARVYHLRRMEGMQGHARRAYRRQQSGGDQRMAAPRCWIAAGLAHLLRERGDGHKRIDQDGRPRPGRGMDADPRPEEGGAP